MRKKSLVLSIFLLLLVPITVYAQAGLVLPEVQVQLWPEYDQPSVLVIYDLTLPEDVTLPREMSFKIPASVAKPHAVAAHQPDGNLYLLPYEANPTGDWTEITFQANSPKIRIEYYDPALTTEEGLRRYTYHWVGDYAVGSLVVRVQQPSGASEMSISPGLGNGKLEADGFTYFTSEVGAMPAGQAADINLSYRKTTDALSVSGQELAASAPLDGSAAGRSGISEILPYLAAALGLVLFAGGGLWYWQSNRPPGPARTARRGRRSGRPAVAGGSAKAAPPPSADSQDYIYCHQCGRRAASGDRFCRACGAPLRSG